MSNETTTPENAGRPPAGSKSPRVGRQSSVVKMMEERAKFLKTNQVRPVPDDDEFRQRYPQLWDLFTVTRLGGQWDRNPPTLTITLDGSLWRATYRDNALKQVISTATTTFSALLSKLDADVCDPEKWSEIKDRNRKLKDATKKE